MPLVAELLWTPPQDRIERANVTQFARRRGLPEDYGELWKWSVDNLDEFWAAVWDEWVEADAPYERVLGGREMPGAEWFPGARLNYAKHIFRNRDSDAIAIRHTSESRQLGDWTWGRLAAETAQIAAGLRELGVEKGDRVAAYMPNIPETIAAFLATASIGAVWSSAAPEFGARSVIDRFAQIEPKLLLTVDGYRHGGKDFDRLESVRAILAELPTVEHVVLAPYLNDRTEPVAVAPGAISWRELLAGGASVGASEDGASADGASGALEFEQVPFAHPLWVLYSSGT